jgi:hypothetical protein
MLTVLLRSRRGTDGLRRSLPAVREVVASGIVATGLIGTAMWGQSRFVPVDRLDALDNISVLDHVTWPGQPFKLADEVRVEADLMQGAWDGLLFRHSCDLCHNVMRQIERTPQQIRLTDVALVAIDGAQRDMLIDRLADRGGKVGHLSE